MQWFAGLAQCIILCLMSSMTFIGVHYQLAFVAADGNVLGLGYGSDSEDEGDRQKEEHHHESTVVREAPEAAAVDASADDEPAGKKKQDSIGNVAPAAAAGKVRVWACMIMQSCACRLSEACVHAGYTNAWTWRRCERLQRRYS